MYQTARRQGAKLGETALRVARAGAASPAPRPTAVPAAVPRASLVVGEKYCVSLVVQTYYSSLVVVVGAASPDPRPTALPAAAPRASLSRVCRRYSVVVV